MKPVRASVRVFVYGTEDEARIRDALLRLLGWEPGPKSQSRFTRSRIKGHYGTEILMLEAVLKSKPELAAFFDALDDGSDVRGTLAAEFKRRVDEDRVLHFRIDKQEAVRGRWTLGTGGDTFQVDLKYAGHGDAEPEGFPR